MKFRKSERTGTLTRFRECLIMSKAAAARETGIAAHIFDNIERGRTPLSRETANMLEASTGCSATSLLAGDDPLLAVNGDEFSQRTFSFWRNDPVHESAVQRTTTHILMRARLLLVAAADHSPALYRATLLHTKNAMESVREQSGISFAQLRAAARKSAVSEDHEYTLKQLDEKLRIYPEFQAERKNLDSAKKIKVRIDRFLTWDDKVEWMIDEGKMDPMREPSTTLEIWRIEKKDQKWFEVLCYTINLA